MIDDTPEVKWSTAWWTQQFGGIFMPIVLLVLSGISFITGHSYAIARASYRMWFVDVYGFQATLMAFAYIAIALSLFAYCFMRYHKTWSLYYEFILAIGLVSSAIPLVWCSMIFITG